MSSIFIQVGSTVRLVTGVAEVVLLMTRNIPLEALAGVEGAAFRYHASSAGLFLGPYSQKNTDT